MRKTIVISAIIVLFILGIIIGIILIKEYANSDKGKIAEEESNQEIYNTIDQRKETIQEDMLVEETNAEEEKISPNCSITFRRHYNDCGHILEQYSSVPTELVNKTEEELQQYYDGWIIQKFSKNQIVLYRDFDSECGEHYVLKEKDGKVAIYIKVGDVEELIEETDIATEFLTETDKIELLNGIEANGRAELNQLIEDYE